MKATTQVALLGVTLVLTACTKNNPAPQSAVSEVATPAATAMLPPKRKDFDTLRVIHGTLEAAGGTEETQPPCEGCAWATFAVHEAPVSELECIKDNSPHPHCHMEVEGFSPASNVTVTKVGDKYHFELSTAGHPDTGIDCPALDAHPDFPDIIYGKCLLRHPGLEGAAEHDLGAILELIESTGKHRVRFVYSHTWPEKPGVPIHNGEGHAHPGGG